MLETVRSPLSSGAEGIKAAAALDAPLLMTVIVAEEGERDAFNRGVEVLNGLVRMAADRGVILCTEPHVGYYVHDTRTMLEFMESVDPDHVGLVWDPSHLWRGSWAHELGLRPRDLITAEELIE